MNSSPIPPSAVPRSSTRPLNIVVGLAAAFAILAGVITLVGWKFDLPRLTDWTNQGISMFPNAALCAIFSGLALVLVRPTARPQEIIASRIVSAGLGLLAGLILLQHLTGVNLGIDTLLFNRPWGQRAAAAPMRMGVPASVSFLVLGVALALSTFPGRNRTIAAALATATLAIISLSLTGYWFGANQLFGVARYTGIALLTSSVIAAVSVGLMATIPEHGLVAALRRDDAGGSMIRRLIIPIIAVPLLLGWVRILGQHAGFYDLEFGTALRTLVEIVLFVLLLWWTASNISWHAQSAATVGQRLSAIIESSYDAIVSKTLDGIIRSWNSGAERTFGYSASEAVGRHISLIIPPERLNEENEIIARLKRGERIDHFDTIRMRKDGVRINISLTVSPIRNADGRIIGASKIARDVSDRKALEAERETLLESERAARSEAERASRLKDEFLATLSHELRTPLNAIYGWSQILTPDSERADLAQGLDAIQRNARAQAQLIEDLLDMSRIISGKVRLNVQPTDLADVIQSALESVRPAAEAKEIILRKVLDHHAGQVSGDATRLQQIVWNLLTNAIKFTPKGGKVDVILARVNSHLEITVHDSGIGIEPEFLPIIFERFRQVDSSTTRSHGGLGLGLSIVKQLVELHGGTIRAESAGTDLGATFVVTLPLSPLKNGEDRVHPAAVSVSSLDCGPIDLSGTKVLVVDDEPDARVLIERLLKQCGADVTTAGSALEGMQCVRSFRPHVLVSDVGMPITDGYQFMRDVRSLADDEGGRTPAIALTAFARSEDRMRAMLAGFQVHVAKPIEPQELAVAIQSLRHRSPI